MIGSRQKTAISADRDFDLGPGLADLSDDPLELLDRAGRTIDVRRPEPGAEQVIAAEDVERKIAIVLVISMKEATKLIAVDRVVGGVEIENDLGGRLVMGLEKEGHEQSFDLAGVAGDLFVATVLISADGSQFESVERAFSGQSLASITEARSILAGGVKLADDGGQERVGSEVVVVIEVFISQSQSVDPLSNEVFEGMFDEIRVAMIGEALGELVNDGGELLGFSEQQSAAVGGDIAAIKLGEHFAGTEHGKIEVG
jgi:hypothetical protein